MRTILLSFQPYWFNKIMVGEKIFEYRWQFPKEEVMAYLYVSRPVQVITGYMHFGDKIELVLWKEHYDYDKETIKRIDEHMTRNRFVMPILSYQKSESIPLKNIKEKFPNFVIPQSYYYLDNFSELFEYIKASARLIGKEQENSFSNITDKDICQ